MIADSHCHLDYENLYSQLDDVIKRAEINNVTYLLTICTTLDSFEKIKQIVKKYKNIYGTFGIHPHECSKNIVTKNAGGSTPYFGCSSWILKALVEIYNLAASTRNLKSCSKKPCARLVIFFESVFLLSPCVVASARS